MKLHTAYIIFLINLVQVTAKISGGPRGRFSNHQTHGHHHVSAHHAHYSYHPPNQIHFTCRYCSSPSSYPVYHGLPPTYVYRFRESGSRFGDLLTGLALYNLGRSITEHSPHSHYYAARDDEKCSLQVIERSHFEETIVPCFVMSSFMESVARPKAESHLVDIKSSHIEVEPFVKNSDDSIKITRDQECVLWHNMTMLKERNNVPCALLKAYSETMKPSGVPVYIWLPVLVVTVIIISLCCRFWRVKKKNDYITDDDLFRQPPHGNYYPDVVK